MRRKPLCQPGMVAASERKPGQNAASIAGEQSPGRQRQPREPGKPTWRCLNRLSLSSAWLAPLNRGSLNSTHIRGTLVPVEEPSTASKPEVIKQSDPRSVGRSQPRVAPVQESGCALWAPTDRVRALPDPNGPPRGPKMEGQQKPH